MVAADIVPDDMALGGDWYEGDTGSSLSAAMGGCNVFSVGREWMLVVCMGVDAECACGDVCSGCSGWAICCGRLYWSMELYGEIN
jgi:hypothetical protein